MSDRKGPLTYMKTKKSAFAESLSDSVIELLESASSACSEIARAKRSNSTDPSEGDTVILRSHAQMLCVLARDAADAAVALTTHANAQDRARDMKQWSDKLHGKKE